MKKEVYKALEAYEESKLQDLILRMENYVIGRLGKKSAVYEGLEARDFVFNVVTKALNGERNFDPEKVAFEEFLFGSLRSDISASINKRDRRKVQKPSEQEFEECYITDLPMFRQEAGYDDPGLMQMDFAAQKEKLLEYFGKLNEIDGFVLECWCDGIVKPKEVADILGLDIKEVYKSVKRLERKRIKLQKDE